MKIKKYRTKKYRTKKYKTKKYRTKKYKRGGGWFSSNPSSNSNDEIQNLKQKYEGNFGFEEWYNNYINRKGNDPNIKKFSRSFRQITNTEKSYEDKYLRSYEYVEYKKLKKEEEEEKILQEEKRLKEKRLEEERLEEEKRIKNLVDLFVEVSNNKKEYSDVYGNYTQNIQELMTNLNVGTPNLIFNKLVDLITNSNLTQIDKNGYIAELKDCIKNHNKKSNNYFDQQLLINQTSMNHTHSFTSEEMLKFKEEKEKEEKEKEEKEIEIYELLGRYNELNSEDKKRLLELIS